MEKLFLLTFTQNMSTDILHFKSKVDIIDHLQLTTEHAIPKIPDNVCWVKNGPLEKAKLKFEQF